MLERALVDVATQNLSCGYYSNNEDSVDNLPGYFFVTNSNQEHMSRLKERPTIVGLAVACVRRST